MKVVACVALFVATFVSSPAARDGDLDRSFGSGGRATMSFDRPGGPLTDNALKAIALADGKTLVIGRVLPDGPSGARVGCVRLDAEGRPDLTYGALGQRTLDTQFTELSGVASDLVYQTALYGSRTNAGNVAFWVHGITTGCETNTAFGAGGTRQIDFDLGGDLSDIATTAAWGGSPYGLFIAGSAQAGAGPDRDFAVAKLDVNGNLDPSFSTDGKARVFFDLDSTANTDIATDISLRANLLMLAGTVRRGTGTIDVGLARLTIADGLLDTTFCPPAACVDSDAQQAGKRTARFQTASTTLVGNVHLTFAPDAAIYVAATTSVLAPPPVIELLGVLKLAPGGAFDTTFGTSMGRIVGTIDANTRPLYIRDAFSGLIIAGSTATNAFTAADPQARMFIARLSSNTGGADNSFSSDLCASAFFCRLIEFAHAAGQPTVSLMSQATELTNDRFLLAGSRLFTAGPGINDTDFAVARITGEIFLRSGFE